MLVKESTLIQKEELYTMHFVHTEVLAAAEDKTKRRIELYRAMLLGNVYHSKVKIVFETLHGIYAVETTIWHTSEDNITLKGGAVIPVCSIREVIF